MVGQVGVSFVLFDFCCCFRALFHFLLLFVVFMLSRGDWEQSVLLQLFYQPSTPLKGCFEKNGNNGFFLFFCCCLFIADCFGFLFFQTDRTLCSRRRRKSGKMGGFHPTSASLYWRPIGYRRQIPRSHRQTHRHNRRKEQSPSAVSNHEGKGIPLSIRFLTLGPMIEGGGHWSHESVTGNDKTKRPKPMCLFRGAGAHRHLNELFLS